jgi:hypothetical protein
LRRILVLIAGLIATAAVAAPAIAANPHFIGTPSISQQGNSLVVSFKAAGLGNAPEATFSLNGTVDVSSRCYTRSGNKPQAANKQEVINVDSTETFDVRNGRTNATFTIAPLSTLQCPPGQRVVIESVTYDLDLVYMGDTLTTFTSG